MILQLPWPPSVNAYWRSTGGRVYVSKAGKRYRREVANHCLIQRAPRLGKARVKLIINAHPPDRRARDLDNILKALLDALEDYRVFDNDNQVDELAIVRGAVQDTGYVLVEVEQLEAA